MVSLVKAAFGQVQNGAQQTNALVSNAKQASSMSWPAISSGSLLSRTSAIAMPAMTGVTAAVAAPTLAGTVIVAGTIILVALLIIGCCLDDSGNHFHYHSPPYVPPYIPYSGGHHAVSSRVIVPSVAHSGPVAVPRIPIVGGITARSPALLPSASSVASFPGAPGGPNHAVGSRPLYSASSSSAVAAAPLRAGGNHAVGSRRV